MRIAIILENAPDLELSRDVIEVADGEGFEERVAIVVYQRLKIPMLAVGDTIKIREVP